MAFSIDLTGCQIAITGVTSGIGLGIADEFSRAGATVYGCGRSAKDSPGAVRFRDATAGAGVVGEYLSADVSTEQGASTFASWVLSRTPRVDSLVSNAGRNVFTGVEASRIADWDACMNLDLRAHWLVAKGLLSGLRMAARKRIEGADIGVPSILVNSSNHSRATIPGCFPYNVAKAGLSALVQSFAIELGPAIRSVGVAPGFIDTEGNQTWFDSFPNAEDERSRTESLHPTASIGTVEQIGGLFVFLASRYADFISGTTVLADGGRSALMQDPPVGYQRGQQAEHG